MPLTAADTRTLIRAVEEIHRPSTFLLDTFFPELVEFDTESIDFDVISRGRKLAPYVRPDLPGIATRTGGYETKTFIPPYVKPKERIRPGRALRRRPGEAYSGEMTAAERMEAITLDTLDEHRTAIIRRKEQQAAEVLDTGQLVVEGENYPRKVVDFGAHASLRTALTSTARWGETGVNPLTALNATATNVQKRSGIVATDVIFDPLAAELFLKSSDIRDVLDNRRQSDGEMQLAPVPPISGGELLGVIGPRRFWQFQDFFTNDDDSEGQMLPDYTAIVTSPNLGGVQAHGAIQDADQLVAAEYAPKVWTENDPPVRMAMTQSAPLVVPTRINHIGRIRVR